MAKVKFIELVPCPVCGRSFPRVKQLIIHVKGHNKLDPEYEKSMVAEEEKEKDSYFG